MRGYVVCCRLKQAPEICFGSSMSAASRPPPRLSRSTFAKTCADACRGAVLSAARQSGS